MTPNPADLRAVENDLLAYSLRFQFADDVAPGWVDHATRQMVEAINDAAPDSPLALIVTELLYSNDGNRCDSCTLADGAAFTFRAAADRIAGWLIYGSGSGMVTYSPVEHDCHGTPGCRLACTPAGMTMWSHWKPGTVATFTICAICGHGGYHVQTRTAAAELRSLGARWIEPPTNGQPEWTEAEARRAVALAEDEVALGERLAAAMQKWASA